MKSLLPEREAVLLDNALSDAVWVAGALLLAVVTGTGVTLRTSP